MARAYSRLTRSSIAHARTCTLPAFWGLPVLSHLKPTSDLGNKTSLFYYLLDVAPICWSFEACFEGLAKRDGNIVFEAKSSVDSGPSILSNKLSICFIPWMKQVSWVCERVIDGVDDDVIRQKPLPSWQKKVAQSPMRGMRWIPSPRRTLLQLPVNVGERRKEKERSLLRRFLVVFPWIHV